jgi:hypothetical protein
MENTGKDQSSNTNKENAPYIPAKKVQDREIAQ